MEIRRIENELMPPFPPSFMPKLIRTIPYQAANVAWIKSRRMLARRILNMNGCGFARRLVFAYLAPDFKKVDHVKAMTYRVFAKLFRTETIAMNSNNVRRMELLTKLPGEFYHHINMYFNDDLMALLNRWAV
jgi:hypothetical protein